MPDNRLAWMVVWTVAAVLAWPPAAQAADAPRWLVELARRPAPVADRDADAVVLHDEEQVTVQANGRVVTRRLFAVRVQTKAGWRAASMQEVYSPGSVEIRSLKAWILMDGRTVELGKDHVVDAALVDNDVYNEARVRMMSMAEQVVPGAIFGGESETAGTTIFSQIEWWLHSRWPVERLQRSLTLPPGWNVQATTFNHTPIEPVINGATRTWTVERLPAPLEEEEAPPDDGLVPRIAVTYYGSPRSAAAFDSWESVGRWLAALQEPSARPTPQLAAKARDLTTTATTDLDRLRAIGAYAQKVQYISIQTGIGRGGGYTPHAAADVLQKNYGDCKDKANLMHTLLGTLNIPSFLVTIYSGDPSYVREEWPSPQQFNHAIIAIPVARGTALPAVLEDETGSLLFFDPTDPFTPLGELPLSLQGSFGLVVSATNPRLRRLPSTSAEVHRRERTIVGTLAPDGMFNASVKSAANGMFATRERATYQAAAANGYIRVLESAVRTRLTGATLTAGAISDDVVRNRFALEASLQMRNFGLPRGGLRLLPAAVPMGDLLPKLPPGSRRTPVVLEPRYEEDRFEVALPPTVKVEELPPPQTMETPFGRFDVRWTADGARVVRVLSLHVKQGVIPPADYQAIRTFSDRFREAERMAAVLVGK